MFKSIAFFYRSFSQRLLACQSTRRDFIQTCVEFCLDIAWAIFEPLATAALLIVSFCLSFKTNSVAGVLFFVYMFIGIVAYNYFSVALNEDVVRLRAYSVGVKK